MSPLFKKIIVDFAHTPDGLEKVLISLKQINQKGKLLVVFGCGGNRDKSKRPIMGEVASKYADLVIITSDNPRDEEPLNIINDIKIGIKGDFLVEADRKEAILKAYKLSKEGDIILLAGKGAEETVEVNGELLPYSDYAVIEEL